MKKFFRIILFLFMTLDAAMMSGNIAYATDTARNTTSYSTTSIAYAVLLLFSSFPFCPHRMKRKASGIICRNHLERLIGCGV